MTKSYCNTRHLYGCELRDMYMSQDWVESYYKRLGINRYVNVTGLGWIVL